MEKFISKNKLFIKIIFTYIVILIIPIIFSIFVYVESMGVIQNQICENNIFMLKQVTSNINGMYIQAQQTVLKLRNSTNTAHYFQFTRSPNNKKPYELWKYIEELRDIQATNSDIYLIQVYSNLNKSCVTSSSIFDLTKSYGHSFFYGSLLYEDFNDSILDKKNSGNLIELVTLINEGKQYRTIPYIYSLNNGNEVKPYGQIIIYFSENRLLNLFKSILFSEASSVYLLDEHDMLITSLSGKKADYNFYDIIHEEEYDKEKSFHISKVISGMNTYVTSYKDEVLGWKCIVVNPEYVVMSKLKNVKNTIVINIVISLVFGVSLSVLLSKRNVNPIKELIKVFVVNNYHPKDSYKSEYDKLSTLIKDLFSDKNRYKKEYEEQLPILYSTFLGKLLQGEISDDEEISLATKKLGIDIISKHYVVVLVDIKCIKNSFGNDSYLNYIYDSLLKKSMRNNETINKFLIRKPNKHSLLPLIFCSNKEDILQVKESINDDLTKICAELSINTPQKIFIGVGSIVSNLLDISMSCKDAQDVIYKRKLRSDESIFWYDDIIDTKSIFHYPMSVETSIISTIDNVKEDELIKVLDLIYYENFEKRNLSVEVGRQLLCELCTTLLKCASTSKIDFDSTELFNESLKIVNIEETYNKICEAFHFILNKNSFKQEENNSLLIKEIEQYVQENYSNPEFGLCMIAEKFNMNENYLSYFYKKETGNKLHSFIEETRLNAASILLNNNEIPIKDIAIRVGYRNDQVFRRAYKKNKGISPSLHNQYIRD